MTGRKALLFAHVDVRPGTHYKVHIEIKRENGNGLVCCNLFANRNFDFSQVAFTCDSSGWSLYELMLKTGDFPPTLPVVLRLWRPKNGTGNILVRRITVEQASNSDDEEAKKITSSSGDTNAMGRVRPGHRKLGGQKPVGPSPEEVKRVRISQSIEEQRAKQRAQRRRRLGAPRPRRDRSTRRSRRRGRRQVSQLPVEPTRVMIISSSGRQEAVREAAFKEAGFSVHCFRMGREQGISLDKRLIDFRPDWIHMVLEPPPARMPGPRTIGIVRDYAPQAVVTAWWPHDRFDGDAAAMLRRADMALVDGPMADATFRGTGLPVWRWREGETQDEIREAARNLGRRLGFMDILAADFGKERIEGGFKRLLCFVPEGGPELFGHPEEIPGDLSAKFLPFRTCDDFASAAMDYRPDWIHIHCEGAAGLPWKNALQDVRRKLPRTLVTAWQRGQNPPDAGFMALADSVDHMLIGSMAALPAHVAGGMVHASHWDGKFGPDAGHRFALSMAGLGAHMRDLRRSFLLNRAGNRVDLTVFIGTWNRLPKLKGAVDHALRSSPDIEVEIIVNDAGSTDGTIPWLEQKAEADPRVTLIFSGKRTSFTQAFNEALRIAKGQVICWLSDDIMSRGKTMYEVVTLMRTLGPLDMAAIPIWNSWSRVARYELRRYRNHLFPTVGCMHAETMRRMYGINIDYPYYTQDTDLDYRVLRMGGRIVECQGAMVDHMCELDELRSTNYKKHDDLLAGEKFDLASGRMVRSQHHFPAILLVLMNGADASHAENAALRIREHYSNSHMYVAAASPLPTDKLASLMRAPMPSRREYQKYDIVVEVRPGGLSLAHPAGKDATPFGKRLVK